MEILNSLVSAVVNHETAFLIGFAILILLVVLLMVVLVLRGRRKAKEAEEPVEAPPAEAPRPAAAAEARVASRRDIRRSFLRGLKIYRDHVAGSRDPHLVPWLLAVGAEGSGKTTLLKSLDSNRPPAEVPDPYTGEALGCTWWYFDQAVVLDVGGSAIARADGHKVPDGSWRSLLGILRQHRRRRPADGIVLTLSAEDLIGLGTGGAEALRQHLTTKALAIYDKLWQAQKILGECLPVYVVVTKCDVIPSFESFAAALPDALRAGILGWSNPYPLESAYRPDWVDEAFGALQGALMRTQIELFADRPNDGAAQDIFLFPAHFQQLREPLRLQLNTIFRRTAYQEAMYVRGIYFTGRIAAAAADPLLPEPFGGDRLAPMPSLGFASFLPPPAFTDDFDEPPRLGELAAPGGVVAEVGGEMVFARDLFEQKLFRERDLARVTARWSFERDRAELAWQGAAGLAAIVALALLWQGYGRLDGLNAGFLPVLKQIPDQIALSGRSAATIGTEQQKADDARVGDFTRAVGRIDADWRAPLFPAAWMSGLEGRIITALSIGYHRVVVDATRRRLEERGRDLLTPQPPQTGDTAFTRLKRFLGEAVLLERFSNVFNGITGTPDLKGLPELIQYADGYTLPPEFLARAGNYGFTAAPTNQSLDGASIDASLRPFDLAPFRVGATAQLEALMDAYIQEALAGSAGIQHLRDAAAALQLATRPAGNADIAGAYRTVLTDLDQASGSLRGQDALLVEGDNLGPDLQPLISLIGDSSLFGPAVRDGIVARIRAAVAQQDGSRQPVDSIVGPLAVYDTAHRRVDLSPTAERLRQGLKTLFAHPFMKQQAAGAPTALHGGAFVWDIPTLETAANLSGDFLLFQTRDLSGFPATLKPSVQAAAQQALGTTLMADIAHAQVPLGSNFGSGPTDAALRQQIASFANAFPLFEQMATVFRQADMGAYQASLTKLVVDRTQALLAQVDDALRADQPYVVPMSGLAAWDGSKIVPYKLFAQPNPAALAEWLAGQRQQVTGLAHDFAQPLVTFLGSPSIAPLVGTAPLVDKWSGIIAELDRYGAGRPNNGVKRLDDFITTGLSGIDAMNCAAGLDGSLGGAASDWFSQRMIEIGQQIASRCDSALDAQAMSGYQEIAKSFDDMLAGRYPFGPRAGNGTGPATIDAVTAFFKLFDQKADLVTAALQARPGLGSDGQRALDFIAQMRKVRTFLWPLIPTQDNPDPSFKVTATFRANRDAERGGQDVIEWRMTLGDAATDTFQPKDKLAWRVSDPVSVSLRWARDGVVVPSSARDGVVDAVNRRVTWSYKEPWALIALLQDHTAAARDWVAGAGRLPHMLSFDVTTALAPGAAATQLGRAGLAHLFIGVATYGKGAPAADGKPAGEQRVFLPSFPTWAPLMPVSPLPAPTAAVNAVFAPAPLVAGNGGLP